MKQKHLDIRIKQCRLLAELSSCKRRKVGGLLLDPERNIVLCDGYNGGPRGGVECCGGKDSNGEHICEREKLKISSGERVEVGCIHCEQNIITSAAANGIATSGKWMLITLEPCLLCAKLIKQCGIIKVLVLDTYSGQQGVGFLKENGVEVEYVS